MSKVIQSIVRVLICKRSVDSILRPFGFGKTFGVFQRRTSSRVALMGRSLETRLPSRQKSLCFALLVGGGCASLYRFVRSNKTVGPVVPLDRATCVLNPRVFFDISIDGEGVGRIEMELFANVCPKTVENFRCLCTCEKGSGGFSGRGPPLWYKNSIFHCVIPGVLCQGGDFTMENGTGGESIYGLTFADEFQHGVVEHSQPLLLSMASVGPDTNNSQFVITLRAMPQLDGKNVVFGRVEQGSDVVKKIEAFGSESGSTLANIKIVESGQLKNCFADVGASDLRAYRSLVEQQEVHLETIMMELTRNGRKVDHWIWYVFPNDRAGNADFHGTRVTKETAVALCQNPSTAKKWQNVLEKICDLMEGEQGMRVFPRIDHGRIHWFLKFWKTVEPPSWMQSVVDRLDKFDWPPT